MYIATYVLIIYVCVFVFIYVYSYVYVFKVKSTVVCSDVAAAPAKHADFKLIKCVSYTYTCTHCVRK